MFNLMCTKFYLFFFICTLCTFCTCFLYFVGVFYLSGKWTYSLLYGEFYSVYYNLIIDQIHNLCTCRHVAAATPFNRHSVFRQVAGITILNKYIRFEVYFQKLDTFDTKPKLCSLTHFHGKTTNSAAQLTIPRAMKDCGPYIYQVTLRHNGASGKGILPVKVLQQQSDKAPSEDFEIPMANAENLTNGIVKWSFACVAVLLKDLHWP